MGRKGGEHDNKGRRKGYEREERGGRGKKESIEGR